MNSITSGTQGLRPMATRPSAVPQGPVDKAQISSGADLKDVIVVQAPTRDLLKSVSTVAMSDQVAKDLKSQGAQVEDTFSLLPGAAAKVDQKTLDHLKTEGYLVYDNSPRNYLPEPSSELARTGKRRPKPEPQGEDDAPEHPPTPKVMPKVDVPSMLKTDKVNQAGFRGQNVNVAVIDSGYDHPDVPLVDWHDVIEGSDKPVDPVGHGTHCASDVKTCAPDAGIVAIRVMDEKGQGRPSDIIRGIQYAIQHKDDDHIGVINLSLGGPEDGVSSKDDPIDKAVEAAWNAGIVVVSAAGNSGPKNATVGAPGDDPKAISVGAGLNPNEVSFFSSRGPTSDGKSKPDIVAPGEFIVGWAVPNTEIDDLAKTMDKIRSMNDKQLVALLKKNPDFADALSLPQDIMSMPADQRDNLIYSHLEPMYKPSEDSVAAPGTSFASPEVAGVVADLLSARPDATPNQVKSALLDTAKNMGSQFGANDQGHGFVDAQAAVQNLQRA